MISLGIQYLTRRSVSSDVADASTAEWPPHPARVFMALAAAHFETGADAAEREALMWLEKLSPPTIMAGDVAQRSDVETYVPVNDSHGGIVKRSRQPKRFPSVTLENDHVYLSWNATPPETVRASLATLVNKVTRIGHSSSLVHMFLVDEPPAGSPWIPSENGEQSLRVPEPGLLAYLERAFNGSAIVEYADRVAEIADAKGKRKSELKSRQEERFPSGPPQRTRPTISSWHAYRCESFSQDNAVIHCGPFDPELILLEKKEGRNLGLESTLQLTGALRHALLGSKGHQAPEWLSGHQPDGSPSKRPHVAVFPLAFVGHRHADGHVMGMAIALPREGPTKRDRRSSFGPILFDPNGYEKEVMLAGPGWQWTLERVKSSFPSLTLRSQTWTGMAEGNNKPGHRSWASVTPVVLHHYPDRNDLSDVERIVREAFESALLPQPMKLRIRSVSSHLGAGHAMSMPPFTEGGANLCRYQVHVTAHFVEPVQGPVLVGRGRFRGYGLFRPLKGDPA